MNKKTPKKPFHEVVAERLIEQLKQGTAPWQKPWVPGQDNHSLPYNPSTGKRYRGINTLNLMSQGFSDPRWMTYDQANSVNAQVIKGAKSTPVQYWKFNEEQKLLDDNGKPILDSQGKAKTVIVPLERPRVFFASVFNAEQIEGLPPIEIKPKTPEQTWDAVNRAEKILSSSGANIMHKSQDRAFYSPGRDSITLPEKNQFSDAAGYYATALHELGHWTGHPSRLNRDLGHPFGSEAYAKEELRAEISSMIMGEELGIGHNPEQHTAYVKSWIKVLQDDPLEIFRAAADAEKIQTLLLSYEQKQEQNQEQGVSAAVPSSNTPLEPVRQNIDMESQSMDKKTEKVFIDVPFKEKDEAKAAGARWDRSAGYWSIDKSELPKLNDKWPVVQVEAKPETKLFIAVPYSEKDEAKRIGAKWDKQKKSWYVDPGTDKQLIGKWLVENRPTEQAPALHPREELALVMKEMGFDVTGEHPIMDGKKHRCRLLSDKASVKDQSGGGMYVAFTDGIPAAYISNNRTGESQNWSSKGYSMTNEEKAVLNAQAAAKKQEREAAQAAEHQSVGEGITRLLEVCNLPTGNEKYLQVKQAKAGNLLVIPEPSALQNDPKVLIGANWKESQALREKNPSHVVFTTGDLVVPAHDANGKIWTAQTIQPNGTKMFPSGSQKTGSFHIVGGDMDALAKAPVIIVSEGYATADTLSEAAALPVVSAFDAGNLVTVAKALREIHPNKPMLICGDNDAHQVMTEDKNVGVEKATAAAEAVKGQTLFPIFAPKEQLYPPELPIVTPELWRNKEVTKEQMKAIDTMKKYTDFNDVKTKSALGIDGVKRQVKFAINELLNKQNLQHTQKQEQTQEQNIKKSHVKTRSVSPA
ncbi:zincin-like metallopeptidase domain-containing protein [Shewanella xiamenensis]|uniref:zincin-like metallopeptidase domain-containing protein n=1 Tax=Shewanella TaxID=22 RepID=UPI0015E34B80|nr:MULTISPECIES: zincin-like metallopeptidase domain-containing protein [unclassified Shewanella]